MTSTIQVGQGRFFRALLSGGLDRLAYRSLSALVPTYWDDNMKVDTNLKIREESGKIIAQRVIQALKEKGVDVGKKTIPVG